MTILLLFTMGIGQVWGGVTFSAQDFLDGKHDNTEHATVAAASGLTLKTGDAQLQYYTDNKLDGIQISSSTTNQVSKASSYVEVKADKGYAVASVEFKAVVDNTSNAAVAFVAWNRGLNNTSCDYYETPNFPKKNNTSAPSNTTISFEGNYQTVRLYRQILINNSDKTFASLSSDATKKGAGKSINLFEATVTTKIAPVIEGDDKMLKSETITLVGYPSGGTWAITSGTAATVNPSTGALTSGSSSGDVTVSYTVSAKTTTHTVTVLNTETKTICWNFMQGDLPTACGVTAVGNGAFNEYGYNLAETDVNFAYVDLTSAGYEITAATLTIFPGGTGTKTVKGDYQASLSAATSTTAGEYWQLSQSVSTKNVETDFGLISSIPEGCRVFRITKGNTGCALGKLYLTLKKYVAPSTYTVTLNPAGGSITPVPDGWTLTAGQYVKSGIEDGSSVALLALTKDGHKLNGWKDGENADYTSPVTVTSDLTLTAQWAQTYAVTYVPNNGVLPAETMTDNNAPYKAGDEVTLLANTFTAPENKEFDVWVVTPTAGGDPITVTAGKFTMPAAAVTVTATWKDACAAAPTVSATTLGTTSYTTQVVNCAGISVLGSAGCTISEYGFVYGTTTAPTISDNKKALEGDYTVAGTAFPATTLTGLAMNTKYYVRAYATNSYGTAYGDEVNFTTLESLGNVLVVASSASQTSDAITALRDNGFMVTVSAHDNSRSYTGYDLVVLDESLGGSDAQTTTNEESKIKDVNIPILNLKAFFYTKTNRWNWGTPVNGTSGNEIANISTAFCNAQSHPIFAGLTINDGEIDLIDPTKSGNTLQGVTTNTLVEGKEGYTLATSGTGITFIHELTPDQRGVTDAKYLMIAISNNAKDNLSADGEKLIVNAAKYLVGSTPWTPVEGLGTTTIDATGNPFSEGATMTLTASATGATASTTYAWYKGDTWAEAEAAGTIQAAKTAENSGHIYTKTAASEDAGTYWCVMVKSTGCEATASVEVSVLSCTKPGTPANLVASDLAYTTANLSWDACDNSNGYKITIIKKSDESVVLDWDDCATNAYAATGLTQGTEYTFKVKAVGATGYCDFSIEASKDFTTTAPSIADLVTIADDWTFTPSATIAAGTLAEGNKLFATEGDCDISGDKMRVKENRALTFKLNNGAKVKVTFTEKSDDSTPREMQLGTLNTDDANKAYGHSGTSPVVFDVTADGVVYLTASKDLYFSKMEIMYPHTVTYDLNGGDGTTPTQASKYVGETFTAHDGVTGITAPATKEFDKWVDQDAADVAAGTTYTMPAKNVTLTAQWRNETVKYSVTYDLDDYTAGVAPTETDKAEGDVFAIKAAPARSGYAFMGWLCDIDAQTYQATNNYTMTAAPTTFTAVWKQEFQVTYNLQGHGDPIAAQIVASGGKVTKPTDPEEMLYEFGGWYKEAACTNAWDFDNDVVTTNTELFAKWTEFDGCAYLAPVASGDALAVGDNVNLKSGSLGGTVKVAGLNAAGKIAYNAAGLAFTGGGGDSIRVTLENKMMAGTKITVRLQANDTGNRGLKLRKLDKTEVASLGWSSATVGAVASFTYTVVADDGLDGKKAFILSRNNTVYLKYISVENCAPEEFVVTYKDGSTTMGTEDVYKNGHPTATGIATRKNGYVFQGWSETDGGSVVDLDDITITADKNLYAVYSARVCATSGSIYKFEVATGKVNGNILPSAPASMALTTDNYLASLSGGELEASVTGNNNRLQYVDSKGISFPNGDGGTLTIKLDCPLKENDEIRFINYASNGNGITLSDGVNTMTLNSSNSMDVQTLSVPEAWETEGSYELTMVRVSSKTPKITYLEIYRRPALEGVTVADLTVREGASITPVMTLTPSDALVTSQAWSILSGSDKISINATTGAVTGEAVGDAEIKVVLNEDPLMTATATVHVVETFAQQDVDESIAWDFSKAGVVADAFTGQVLANVDGVTLDASQFDARKLVGTAQNITSTYFQGTMLTFNATEAGRLSVRFTNGNANVRTLKVYVGDPEVEIASWSYSNAATENKSIEVPAGKVTLRSYQGDAPNNVRIMNLEFLELAHQRTTGYAAGDLGTVCLEDATIIDGANLYELAGLDQYGYMAFDQIPSGELEAGKPYLFEVTNPSKISFYKPVGAAHSDSEIAVKGMIGTFSGTTLHQNVAQNYYYFSGRHIWRVNDFTVSIPIPANRCYVDMDALKTAVAPSSPLPGRRRVTLGVNGKNTTTAIDNAEAADAPRKVMINGTLFILRGEKMYDATGRLVK